MTRAEFRAGQAESRTLIDTTFNATNDTATERLRTGGTADSVALLLISSPTVDANLSVTDESGAVTGWDPAADRSRTGIPDSTYSGTSSVREVVRVGDAADRNLTVEVTGDGSGPVQVVATVAPDRPPVWVSSRDDWRPLRRPAQRPTPRLRSPRSAHRSRSKTPP